MPLSTRLSRLLSSLVLAGLLAMGASACGADSGDGSIGDTQQAEAIRDTSTT